MARRPAGTNTAGTTQAEPTRSPPTDDAGRPVDGFGLPLNGPARIAALAGNPDPRDAVEVDVPPADAAEDAD
ncbi:hypothetical protein ASE73_02565 [Sphingomonas sp. Leaf24]|uniref:hypothetical protein n=1 Tax=unclassified Sphingomonas TaxID=196159 RepID=UPI0006F48FC7|nr:MULTISPECIES: hypothetical protein [unclassified Sphingomonas]KQM23126.1 hypothetical protein ASE50_02565 [Sphingomonas sp. Leaf5]KQM95984.1 hypothetical protein ASE73_02565 [Sphingomonas sp. Leaf24]